MIFSAPFLSNIWFSQVICILIEWYRLMFVSLFFWFICCFSYSLGSVYEDRGITLLHQGLTFFFLLLTRMNCYDSRVVIVGFKLQGKYILMIWFDWFKLCILAHYYWQLQWCFSLDQKPITFWKHSKTFYRQSLRFKKISSGKWSKDAWQDPNLWGGWWD